MAEVWKKCTECRKDIEFGATYQQCSVSTCNRSRFPLVFCSVTCWDSHLSSVRHRDAGAIEVRAPSKDAWQREQAQEEAAARPAPAPPRPPVMPAGVASRSASSHSPMPARSASSFDSAAPRPSPMATPDSVQPMRSRSDETRPHVAPPPPAATPVTSGAPVRRVIETSPAPVSASGDGPALADVTDKDVLIVVSKMKKYIKERSGMNCSDAVADMLSDHVRAICDDAIRTAARDERKTVLDRDVPRAPRR